MKMLTFIKLICRRGMKNDCEACKEDLFITSFSVKVTHHNVKNILNSHRQVIKTCNKYFMCLYE